MQITKVLVQQTISLSVIPDNTDWTNGKKGRIHPQLRLEKNLMVMRRYNLNGKYSKILYK